MKGTELLATIFICILVVSSISFGSIGDTQKKNKRIVDVCIPIDTTFFYDIPDGETLQSISISEHKFISNVETKPKQSFVTTDKKVDTDSTMLVYDEPFSYEVLKRGEKNVVRLYAPGVFYDADKKFETEKIVLSLTFSVEQIIQTAKTSYETQADPNPEYIIITDELLWDTFNDDFKEWKKTNDDKINNVLILNVSDITSSDYWVNGSYGDATNTTGGNHWIVDDEEVTTSFNLFNDTQAHIRNFIRFAYDTYNTRYVLLGGNKDLVPPRMIATRASGDDCGTFHDDLSHASDMYYSCLDYCMNNNTNSYFMESECCGYDWDKVDWGFDLMVGRIPVNTVNELNLWINKTKNYVNGISQGNYLKNVIVACKDVDNLISDQTWTILEPYLPSNKSVVNNQNISQAQWNVMDDYCNGDIASWDGIHILYHEGHGGTLWTPYQPANLDNKLIPNYLDTEGCDSGDFGTDTSSRIEQWMSDDGGPFAGIANSASGWFIASTYFSAGLLYHLFNDTDQTSCFCEANNKCRETVGHTEADGVFAMIYKERNFFGDPSLEIQQFDIPQFISIDNDVNGTIVYNSTPTFNWSKPSLDISQYNLQVDNDSDFSSPEINITDVNQHNYPAEYSENTTRISFVLPSGYSLPKYDLYYCQVDVFVKEVV